MLTVEKLENTRNREKKIKSLAILRPGRKRFMIWYFFQSLSISSHQNNDLAKPKGNAAQVGLRQPGHRQASGNP